MANWDHHGLTGTHGLDSVVELPVSLRKSQYLLAAHVRAAVMQRSACGDVLYGIERKSVSTVKLDKAGRWRGPDRSPLAQAG